MLKWGVCNSRPSAQGMGHHSYGVPFGSEYLTKDLGPGDGLGCPGYMYSVIA